MIDFSNGDLLCHEVPELASKEFTSVVNRFTLKGKKAMVTGAAGGIGRSTAKAFAELGADVALMDIPSSKEKLEAICTEIQEKYGVKAIAVLGDVSNEVSVKKFVQEAVDQLGTIDVLHNNAGIILPTDVSADTPVEDWQRLMNIDLNGVMLVGRTVANVMIAHKHGGSIINTASMSAHIWNHVKGHTYGFAYGVAKAGVLHLTKGMAANYIKYGIRVNSISPGVVLSGIHDYVPIKYLETSLQDIPMGRFGYLDEMASIVAFLATDMASYMVGADVLADGGTCIN